MEHATRLIIGLTRSDRPNDYIPFDDGYRRGAQQDVHALTLPANAPTLSGQDWAEAVFVATNAPPEIPVERTPGVTEVRAALAAYGKRMRTLSKGDTVIVAGPTTGTMYACASAGWDEVAAFILAAEATHVGALVESWNDGMPGVVREIHPTGAISVDWGVERTPGVPGSRGTYYLRSALECGALIVRRDNDTSEGSRHEAR